MEEGLLMLIRVLAKQAVRDYREQPFKLIHIFNLLNASKQSALLRRAHEILETRTSS